jgi:hypothetical protein
MTPDRALFPIDAMLVAFTTSWGTGMGARLLILSFVVLKIQPIFSTSGSRGSASDNRRSFSSEGLVRFPCSHPGGTHRAPQAASSLRLARTELA